MHISAVLAIATVATAFPFDTSRDVVAIEQYTPDQTHNNILNYHPDERIVHSDQLHQYLSEHGSENHTVYVSDLRTFVAMSPVAKIQKRQYPGVMCARYTSYQSKNPKSYWDEWKPASKCHWTGYDPAGGIESIAWSTSIAYTETAGLDWNVVKDVLSASLGFSVTETFTKSDTKSCNIPGNSVGQIWSQNKLGFVNMESAECSSCSWGSTCGEWSPAGDAIAPAKEDPQTGCSTGQDKVKC